MTTDDPGDQYERMIAAADKLCKALRDMRRGDKHPSDPNHLEAAEAQTRVYRAIVELTTAANADEIISAMREGTFMPSV
jgi:hypothetical protein